MCKNAVENCLLSNTFLQNLLYVGVQLGRDLLTVKAIIYDLQ